MYKVINLKSRYSDVNTELHFISDNKAIISTNSTYNRIGTTRDGTGITFIDFEGGSMLSVGDTIEGHKIKSIKATYLIEFEE